MTRVQTSHLVLFADRVAMDVFVIDASESTEVFMRKWVRELLFINGLMSCREIVMARLLRQCFF